MSGVRQRQEALHQAHNPSIKDKPRVIPGPTPQDTRNVLAREGTVGWTLRAVWTGLGRPVVREGVHTSTPVANGGFGGLRQESESPGQLGHSHHPPCPSQSILPRPTHFPQSTLPDPIHSARTNPVFPRHPPCPNQSGEAVTWEAIVWEATVREAVLLVREAIVWRQ